MRVALDGWLEVSSVPFVGVILLGIIVAVAWTTAAIVGPRCHARGRREALRTFRPSPVHRLP